MHVPLDDRVRRWLDQAAADLDIARGLRERHPHQACFHAQQCAEKAVKALLTRLCGDALQTHELDRLVTECIRLGATVDDTLRAVARSLDKYYVPTRYPDALGFADAALTFQTRDADMAIESAEVVVAWCNARIADARVADPDPP